MKRIVCQLDNRHKYKRCLLYAKNHKNLGDLAADAARLIGLNVYAFTKETETTCIAYWNRIRDCHYRRHAEWLELAEQFKEDRDKIIKDLTDERSTLRKIAHDRKENYLEMQTKEDK